MKVLLLTHIFPPAVDGGSKVIARLGEYLSKQGHEIMVITSNCRFTDDFVNPHSKRLSYQRTSEPAYPIIRLPVYKSFRRLIKLFRLIFKSDLLQVFEKGPVLKLFPFISFLFSGFSFHPDLIIAGPLPTTIVLYARFFAFLTNALTHQRANLLINASFHTSDPQFQLKPLTNSLQKADYLWTLSDYESNYFINNYQISPNKIINVGNGIDTHFLIESIPKSKFKIQNSILYVGSLSAHKNIETLIDAFKLISPKFPKLKLIIAGKKTLYWPTIRKYLYTLPDSIRNKIIFKFNFPNHLQTKIYDQSSIIIQPSTQESFGLTLVESWARRKPVIVSDIPVFKEIISKSKGGLVFEVNNPVSLAGQISKLLNDPNLSSRLASYGFEYTKKHYTWDKIGKIICQKALSSAC